MIFRFIQWSTWWWYDSNYVINKTFYYIILFFVYFTVDECNKESKRKIMPFYRKYMAVSEFPLRHGACIAPRSGTSFWTLEFQFWKVSQEQEPTLTVTVRNPLRTGHLYLKTTYANSAILSKKRYLSEKV